MFKPINAGKYGSIELFDDGGFSIGFGKVDQGCSFEKCRLGDDVNFDKVAGEGKELVFTNKKENWIIVLKYENSTWYKKSD